jgi:hypothetical protein
LQQRVSTFLAGSRGLGIGLREVKHASWSL